MYISQHYNYLAQKAHFTSRTISFLVVLNLLTLLAEATRLKLMVRKLRYNCSIFEAWNLFSVMQAVNHIVLKAGTFSGGFYLSKKHGISFHKYCAFVVTYVVVMVHASGFLGLGVSFGFIMSGYQVPLTIPLFFFGVIVLSLACIVLARIPLSLSKFPGIVQKFIYSWKEIYTDNWLIVLMVIVEIFYYVFSALRFMMASSVFSESVTFLDSVVVVTIGNFIRVASIVPGGIGVAEIVSGWTAGILGENAGIAGLSAGLDRFIYVCIIMIFGSIGFFTLSGRSEFHQPYHQEKSCTEIRTS